MGVRHYTFSGTTIRVESDFEAHLDWLDEFFVPAFETTEKTPDWKVSLEINPALYDRWLEKGGTGREVATFAMDAGPMLLPLWADCGPGMLLHDPHYRVFLAVDGREILVLSERDTRKLRTPLMRVVREIATEAAKHNGSLLLHASAFAIGDRAAIITGPKNAGKTSLLTYALTAKGAYYLTNDRLVCEEKSGTVHVSAMPTFISIRPGTLEMSPGLWKETEQRRFRHHSTIDECRTPDAPPARRWADGRLGLTPAQYCMAGNCRSIAAAKAAIMLFPRRTNRPDGLTLKRLDQQQTALRLADCGFGQGGPPFGPGGIFATSRVAGGKSVDDVLAKLVELPAFDCFSGNDIFTNGTAGEQLARVLLENH
jgi:hypothetical protein